MSEDGSRIDNKCPKCGSENIIRESQSEYTGGGFADYYDEYDCNECEHNWKNYLKSDFS